MCEIGTMVGNLTKFAAIDVFIGIIAKTSALLSIIG
jgi:uncharacterized membrane protein